LLHDISKVKWLYAVVLLSNTIVLSLNNTTKNMCLKAYQISNFSTCFGMHQHIDHCCIIDIISNPTSLWGLYSADIQSAQTAQSDNHACILFKAKSELTNCIYMAKFELSNLIWHLINCYLKWGETILIQSKDWINFDPVLGSGKILHQVSSIIISVWAK
jgi:hypothetical protein